MPATIYAPTNSRAHWAGAGADLDLHIEAYEGDIDGSFRVNSMFRSSGLTTFKSISGTNLWRGDRVGGIAVKGRRSGETLDTARIPNEKFTITVDTTSYASSSVDYQDDWTGPDYQAEYSAEHGSAHAKAFDEAHVIQLIKAGSWVAPASLKTSGAFYDGVTRVMAGYAADVALNTEAGNIAAANKLVKQHKDLIAIFAKRDLGDSLSEFRTLCDPDTFNILLDHGKLMNVDWQGGQPTNDFAKRRIAYMNGIPVVETPRFVTTANPSHHLGPAFNLSAAEAKARMVVFHPKQTLLTVEACPMTVRVWDNEAQFTNVLDSYCMYTVGLRRGDAVGVIASD